MHASPRAVQVRRLSFIIAGELRPGLVVLQIKHDLDTVINGFRQARFESWTGWIIRMPENNP